MCAICGIYFLDGRPLSDLPVRGRAHAGETALHRMARSMMHRGPDDEGFYIEGSLGLGHQRLSVIDLSPLGHQPMTNEDGSLWIVFNGEIYNYLELRQQLVSRGHRFRSHSDTEVILHLYADEGPDCVSQLNGMFAFAIWDKRRRTLFGARDRFGVKPFYYVHTRDYFLFASEIKALFKTRLVAPLLNFSGLADYLTFQFCLGEKTLFQNVLKLLPGHTFLLKPDGTLQLKKYWELHYNIDMDRAEKDFEQQLLMLMEDAVRLQLRADVAVGAHLSGGLDSSTITCLASSLSGRPVRTFSGGFRDSLQYDETRYARIVSRHIGSEHHEIFPAAPDFVNSIQHLIYMMDEPAGGPGLFSQYFVSKLASQHVKVVLGGQGGDEIFGGYIRYLIAYLERCLKGGIEGTQEDQKYIVTFDSILPNLTQLRGYESLLKDFLQKGVFEPEDKRYLSLIDRGGALRNLINPDFLPDRRDYDGYEIYRNLFYASGCQSLINKLTSFDMKTLLPALLHVEDRASMAVSLESRVPLLDHRIAELAASMPPMIKYKGAHSKHIFRQAICPVVPAEICSRTDKMGFPVPFSEWCRQGPVKEFVSETLLGPRARSRGIVKTEHVSHLLRTEQSFGRGVWGLLCLELWAQTFLDGDDPVNPIPPVVHGKLLDNNNSESISDLT